MFRKLSAVIGDLCFRTFWIFLVLRLIGIPPVITWSWVAITSPIWGGFIAIFFVSLLGALVEEGKQADDIDENEE